MRRAVGTQATIVTHLGCRNDSVAASVTRQTRDQADEWGFNIASGPAAAVATVGVVVVAIFSAFFDAVAALLAHQASNGAAEARLHGVTIRTTAITQGGVAVVAHFALVNQPVAALGAGYTRHGAVVVGLLELAVETTPITRELVAIVANFSARDRTVAADATRLIGDGAIVARLDRLAVRATAVATCGRQTGAAWTLVIRCTASHAIGTRATVVASFGRRLDPITTQVARQAGYGTNVSPFTGTGQGIATVTAHRVVVVALFRGFQYAVATLLTRDSRCDASEAVFDIAAVRNATVAVVRIAVVANLILIDHAVAAQRTRFIARAAVVSGLDELTIEATAVPR